jgi:peptide deformylase
VKLLIWPNSLLKQASTEVDSPLEQELIDQMTSLMIKKEGLGLSAIQIGLAKRFFLLKDTTGIKVCVNPVIKVFHGAPCLVQEGCLSIPGQFETVSRYLKIDVEYFDSSLIKKTSETLYQLSAQCFQHEMDHLNGIFFVDKLSSARRSTIIGNLQKLKRSGKL